MKTTRRDFAGNDRFAVRRRLGSGGHGIVYEVFDRERGSTVALKALGRKDPGALLRFKYEFRALTDLHHPNLVSLYELLSDEDEWFLTMELVDGCDFLSYVWRFEDEVGYRGPSPFAESPTASRLDASPPACLDVEDPAPPPVEQTPADIGRLEAALKQLGTGLRVLHEAGKLHRDIKPSNVLVSRDGRVKILDFGLVKELVSLRPGGSTEIAGTPAYMSPEQAAGGAVSAASDWYSVGTLLYEALTGQRPFHGPMADVIARKQRFDCAPPSSRVSGVPPHLDTLCAALLHRDPEQRAAWSQVAQTVAGGEPASEIEPFETASALFIGRDAAVDTLQGALADVRAGNTVVVALHGRSGMGKSTLARRFLTGLAPAGRLILESCCYAQESVPYKAVDGLVDGLTEHVRHLPPTEALELLPRDLPALARLFPVLNQFLSPSEAVKEIRDLQELRRRAARALRELLVELGERLELVVFIDDLQWGDPDSAPLLVELLAGAETPRMLLVVAYRSEDRAAPVLQPLLALRSRFSSGLRFREIVVGELAAEDARTLARQLIGDRPGTEIEIDRLARESTGNPFFLQELARAFAREASGAALRTDGEPLRLGDLIERRIERLGDAERRMLEVVSVAGEPVSRRVAADAAGVGTIEPAVLARLRSEHLIRESMIGGFESIAAYHDRIRETLVAALPEKRQRDHHRALASAMERSVRPDVERMSIHFRAAGDVERAGRYAAEAAERSVQALAFDRAARLYRIALDTPGLDEERLRVLRVKLAQSLANAGRSYEAAPAYLTAAVGASEEEAIELRRCAAEQFLRGGHVNEGLTVLRDVMRGVGLSMPTTRLRALMRLMFNRAHIALRGLSFKPRPESELSARERTRIDACWSVTFCLGFVDLIFAGYVQSRHLLWSLAVGEPYRVALALSAETAYRSPAGSRSRKRTLRLLERATRLAEEVARPHSTAMVRLCEGVASNFVGRWREGAEKTEEAERIFREQCTGMSHELGTAVYWRLFALAQCGRLGVLKREVPLVLQDAHERGDLYLGTNVRLRVGFLVPLAADDPAAALAELDGAIADWSAGHASGHISHQNVWHLVARMQALLYQGQAAWAWETYETRRREFRITLTSRVQLMRIHSAAIAGRAALTVAGEDRARLVDARRCAVRLRREDIPWSQAFAALLEAGIASRDGRPAQAEAGLRTALVALEQLEMGLVAAAARRSLGLLLGGDAGALLRAEAEKWMRAEGVVDPARMAAMLAPGHWASSH
jgi:hypothetical protein